MGIEYSYIISCWMLFIILVSYTHRVVAWLSPGVVTHYSKKVLCWLTVSVTVKILTDTASSQINVVTILMPQLGQLTKAARE